MFSKPLLRPREVRLVSKVGLLLCLLLGARIAYAQENVTISRNVATVDFPNTIAFELDYAGDVVEAVLTYDIVAITCVEAATSVPVEIETEGTVSWEWIMIRSGNPPPGSEVWWQWTLTDANGNTTTTSRQTVMLIDTRFEWRTVETERIALHWYRGDDVGQVLLDSAETALIRLENDIGITVSDKIDIFIYGNAREMREAVLYIQDWAGGVAFSSYNTILMGVEPSEADDWGVRTVAHELAHLVLGQFGRSCVGGSRPSWLEEGLATVAEGNPDEFMLADIENGIEDNSFVPLRSLNGSFPAHNSGARSAYSQSYSVAQFMLDEYGANRMQELILLLADGVGYDAAVEQIYGVNLDGLELAWRDAIGAPEREILPTQTPIVVASIPTIPPIAAVQDVPTPANIPLTTPPPAEQAPAPTNTICGLGFIPLFLVSGFWFNRRKVKQV